MQGGGCNLSSSSKTSLLFLHTMPILLISSPSMPTIHHASQPSMSITIGQQSGQAKRLVLSDPEQKDNDETIETDSFNLFESIAIGLEINGDESKCKWLMSQIIGGDAEFDSPFGPRRITYSDHTASGRFLRFVEEYLEREVLPFYGNTHTMDSYVGLHTSKLVHEACRYIKRCVGAGPQDALLFCGSGATAAVKRLQEVMGIAVPSVLRSKVVDCLMGSERWVVFTGPYEHHSNLLSWRQSLAEVVEIGLDESGHIDLGSLIEALESPEYSTRPKLGSFSACSNVTGIYTDTRTLARVLHDHGACVCFDFACSGPYVNIDMRSGEMDGYDAVFMSPHKFIGGPGSPGILVMSEALYHLKGRPPSTSGGGTVRYVNSYDDKTFKGQMGLNEFTTSQFEGHLHQNFDTEVCVKEQPIVDPALRVMMRAPYFARHLFVHALCEDTLYCEHLEEREDAGTPGIVQKIRAALAFRVKECMGHLHINSQETLLIDRALGRLLKNPNVHVLGNTYEPRQPIVSFLIYPGIARGKHLHCRFVTKLLNDVFGIQARGGCACAGPYGHVLLSISRSRAYAIRFAIEKGYEGVKPGWTRVSFSYYTPVEEMEFVVDAIEFVAMYGHRFLALYRFDWRTGNWCFNTQNYKTAISGLLTKTDASNTTEKCYAKYMDVAKRTASTLPDFQQQPCQQPEFIDPELVTFMI